LINESLGRTKFEFNETKLINNYMPFLSDLINSNRKHWFLFTNSLASSTATDVSIPSLVTGICPTKSSAQLHDAPLIWDWLESCNHQYFKIFSSPVDFRWANLEFFLGLNEFDCYVRASDLPGPIINDLGNDEYYSAFEFSQSIKNAPSDRPIMGVYFSNALHSPFQISSEFLSNKRPSSNRFYTAMSIVDDAISVIINAIKESHRFNNCLIFIIGDHGETYQSTNIGHRLYSFREDYWSAFMAIYVSQNIQDDYPQKIESLRLNQQSLVGLIDVLPSLIDLLIHPINSFTHTKQLDGYSLFNKIPEDRFLIGLNTNETRKWPQEGFGIAQGKMRFIFDNIHGSFLYNLESDALQKDNLIDYAEEKQKFFLFEKINKHPQLIRVFTSNQ
jgi:membrane-anchored protein YejM (alkaline phosphatase superfamily)